MSPQLSSRQGRQRLGRRVTSRRDVGGSRQQDEGQDSQYFGDPLTPKSEHFFRIFLLNIGGLMQNKTHLKNQALRQILIHHQVDICCLTETNLHWKLLPPEERQYSRFQYWFETLHTNISYFESYPYTSWHQVGGTCLLSINEAANRVKDSGKDPILGRWSWTRYRGKNDLTLRVFSAYRPTLSTGGTQTAYSQQKWYYQTQLNQNPCPRTTMIDDLCTQIQEAMQQGDQIIVAIDANDDLRAGEVQQKLSHCGLVDINLFKHGAHTLGTYNRGTAPIDGLWVSSTLMGSQCGYLPHGEGPPGCDHCILWMDIPKLMVFGNKITSHRPSVRRMKTKDPRIVRRFNDYMVGKLHDHNLLDRCRDLHAQTLLGEWTEQMAAEWEDLDRLRMTFLAQADKKCRKLRMGNVPYSPQVSHAMKVIWAWRLLCRHHTTSIVNGRYMRRELAKLKMPFSVLRYSLEQCQYQHIQAVKAYYKIKPSGWKMRVSYMEDLAAAKAAELEASSIRANFTSSQANNTGNESMLLPSLSEPTTLIPSQTTTAKILKQLKFREQQTRNSRILKQCTGSPTGQFGIPMVIAPGPTPGSRVACYTKEDIEQALIEENKRRFWQASETPFLQPPLYDKVGPLGIGPGADEILTTGQITLNPGDPPLHSTVLKYIQQLKKDDNLIALPLHEAMIDEKKHKAAWKAAKEATSSGDPILHFGHCKAMATHPNLCEFEAKMKNIPFITGYSPHRYQHLVDVELLKKANNFFVQSFRTIKLFEAEDNSGNKTTGRDLMWHAERQNLIAPEQYGSRKNRAASTQALNKKLVFDLFRQQRLSGAIGSNDAKSCYDRIVHSVAMLSMRRMGYPVEPLISMFTTLQKARNHIRTPAGDSDIFYDGSHTNIPIQGTGQGNGASPTIWAVVSTPLLKLLRIEDLGVFFQSALDNEEVKLVGFAFVDDFDLATSARGSEDSTPEEEVTARMQKSFDTWISGLHATGGAVNADKSNWTLIAFNWDADGKFSYKTISESPADVWVTDFDGQRKKLRRIEATQGDRMLGVRLSADGLDREEVEFRKEQAKSWHDKIRTGHLPRHLAWQSLTTQIMPQLEYPLPATTFTRQQCKEIISPVLKAGLSSSGIVRTISPAIVYGPLKYQGLGIHDLYVTQGTAHLEKLINHAYSIRDPTGQLLRASAQHLLLELGTGQQLFEHDYRTLGHVATRSWMKHTWQFCSEFGIQLESTLPTLQLQCPNDQFLMEAFQQHYSKGLDRLNRCRMYLNVCTLAEITTADGRYITQSAWNGQRATIKTNQYTWPNQHRPSNQNWQFFKEALCKTFGVHPIHRSLAYPLTDWNLTIPWQYFYCQEEQRVYSRQSNGWDVHLRTSSRSTRQAATEFHRQPASTTETLPTTAKKISVHLTSSKVLITGISTQNQQAPSPTIHLAPTRQNFRTHLDTLPDSLKWAWPELYMEGSPQDLLAAIEHGKGKSVSDGSYKITSYGVPFGTSSWIFSVSDSLWIRGSNSIPGSTSSQSSYRSELGGLFGQVYILTSLIDFLLQDNAKSLSGTIHIGCDGESALNHCFSPAKCLTSSSSDYDMIIAIRRRLYQYPNLEWKTHHIKGHQDDHQNFEDLDPWAQLNVQCDRWAKERWHYLEQQHGESLYPPQVAIQNAPWAIRINGNLVNKHLKATLREHCSGSILQQYWEKRKRFKQQPATTIDWDSSHKALKSMNQGQRREFIKHHSGNQATNKNMLRRKKRDTEACPRCSAPVEDSKHIITCPHPTATELWEKSLDHIEQWLQNSQTDPKISSIILSRLHSWRTNTDPEIFDGLPITLDQLLFKQDNIGWEAAFRGCWSHGWAEAQEQYFKTLKSRKSGRRWLAALIKKLWQVAWDMWEHRNGIIHDKEQGQLALILKRDIQLEYSKGFSNLPSDLRQAARLPIDQVLKWSLKQQQNWLGRIQDGRNFGTAEEQQARRQVRAQQQFMADWLATA